MVLLSSWFRYSGGDLVGYCIFCVSACLVPYWETDQVLELVLTVDCKHTSYTFLLSGWFRFLGGDLVDYQILVFPYVRCLGGR